MTSADDETKFSSCRMQTHSFMEAGGGSPGHILIDNRERRPA